MPGLSPRNSISESWLTEYKHGISNLLTATRKIKVIPNSRNNLYILEEYFQFYKNFGGMLCIVIPGFRNMAETPGI
jgi:hypothetical protein